MTKLADSVTPDSCFWGATLGQGTRRQRGVAAAAGVCATATMFSRSAQALRTPHLLVVGPDEDEGRIVKRFAAVCTRQSPSASGRRLSSCA